MARFIEWHDFDQRGLLSLSPSLYIVKFSE